MREILALTEDFKSENKIGEGVFGEVYKANLGLLSVIVKRFHQRKDYQVEALSELRSLMLRYRYPYLVPVLGFTDITDAQPCMVVQYIPQGNLRQRLEHNADVSHFPIPWDMRVKIAMETAMALHYLHYPHPRVQPIYHLNMKSENILLDNGFEVRVTDYALVKILGLYDEIKAAPASSHGHICPHYLKDGTFSEKTDVYSFGVILAELLTGKPAGKPHHNSKSSSGSSSKTHLSLAAIFREALPHFGKKGSNPAPSSVLLDPNLLDPTIKNTWPLDSYMAFARLARECVDLEPENRPTILEAAVRTKELFELVKVKNCVVCGNSAKAKPVCGHVILCSKCAEVNMRRAEGCPFCRLQFVIPKKKGLFN